MGWKYINCYKRKQDWAQKDFRRCIWAWWRYVPSIAFGNRTRPICAHYYLICISTVHCMQGCPTKRYSSYPSHAGRSYNRQSNLTQRIPSGLLKRFNTSCRVFTTSGCSLHQGVHYIRVFTTSGCSIHQGVHYIRVFTTSGCSLHQGVQYIRVFTTSGCSLHQGVHYIRCSLHQGVHYIRVFTTSGFIVHSRSMFIISGSSL